MNVYMIWLVGVIIWNFGFPEAEPIKDVVIVILLSILSLLLKKYFKL
mgnify:CR=1|jgi:hypothetical protein|tara:strand:+ start:335 stop:475 length:141 start_codon:yes stop_codon:yes gene_type:complete